MGTDWRDAVFRIDSAAKDKPIFGSGFACFREGGKTYLLSCNHVIEDIGADNARVLKQPIEVVARGDDTLDLALISVAGLSDRPVLQLGTSGKRGNPFEVYGYTWANLNDKKSGRSIARSLEGLLGADTAFTSDSWPKVPAWDLSFDENNRFAELLDGYSGSPVWDPESQQVIAVVSHRRGAKMGYAIAVSNLLEIYPEAEAFFQYPPQSAAIAEKEAPELEAALSPAPRVEEEKQRHTEVQRSLEIERPNGQLLPAEPADLTRPIPFRDSFLASGTKGPEMVWLPSGTFEMGAEDISDADKHNVSVSYFAAGKYPVTLEEYDQFCVDTSREKPHDNGWGRRSRPVIGVSWEDAEAYCQWLRKRTGEEYRLLTEAQWEYACRAGSNTAFSYGDDEKRLHGYAWYLRPSKGRTHPVGEKRPNPWGLHDMHGNVWEWVQDRFGTYPEHAQSDPRGPASGSTRVLRGGSWQDTASHCRSAYRYKKLPDYRSPACGFRLARLGPLHSYPIEWDVPQPKAPIPGLCEVLEDGAPAPMMTWLPGGTFIMGDDDGSDDERPVHEVLVNAFSIGQYPITFSEYDRFCQSTRRPKPNDRDWGRGDRPAIYVSWEEAVAYCDWLSGQTSNPYRLPTEAEWEYACRAGSATRYCFGNNQQKLPEYAWYSENSSGRTHPVGQFLPNPWVLYDMHGNVLEWVNDRYSGNYYKRSPREKPTGPQIGPLRVVRGGSWADVAWSSRSASRGCNDPSDRCCLLGFRLARDGAWPPQTLQLSGTKKNRDAG